MSRELLDRITDVRIVTPVKKDINASPWKRTGRFSIFLLLAVSLGLPLVLALHAVYAGREVNEMRSMFLRERAANIAARMEGVAPERLRRNDFQDFVDSDPAILRIYVFPPEIPAPDDAAVAAIRSGQELYRAAEVNSGSDAVFRAYIPFESEGEVYVARIDLLPTAPDFLLDHARNNTLMAIVSGSALLLVSVFALWNMRRSSRLERRHLETERLAELGTLSAVLAHEIRNPLGAIKGFAQLARESADPGKTKPLDAIVRESLRLEALVESLLLYGRPVKPTIVQTDWRLMAEDLESYAHNLIGAREVRFANESEIENLLTDPNMLKQALLNLIRNSVEAIPAGSPGVVRLLATPGRNGAILIAVEDDGPGLAPEVRARLFSPFVSTKASGAGLGLSISKKLVETLGGRLRLLDVEPHGTRAEVELYGTNSRN